MGELWTSLAVAVAGPLGAAAVLALALLAAAGLAERINPEPPADAEEQVREAVEQQRLQAQLDAQIQAAERERGREPVDSTHVSFPAFGIAFLMWLVLTSWTAALEHLDDPGEGFPLALALRPLWSALIAATLAGVVVGFFYRRWFRRQPPQRRADIRARLEAKERHDFTERLRAIRSRPRRRSDRHGVHP
ncbi:hypothetical protein [Glycomyces sp. MUSA5-2]|uniref:hypothetical protein n=1 Tax=Glycomyces sp. MUSA5-2 TaxID=2053002 RepID=UPI00300931FD